MGKEKTVFLITLVSSLIILIVTVSLSAVISKRSEDLKPEIKLDRSVYNNRASGYAAFYKVLQNAGLSPKIWRLPFANVDKIKEKSATMVIASPENRLGASYMDRIDANHLLNWVRIGNNLVVIDDFSNQTSRLILSRLNMDYKIIDEEGNKPTYKTSKKPSYSKEKTIYEVNNLKELSYNVEKISSTSLVKLEEKNLEPVVKDSDGIVVAERKYGQGTIYIVSLPDMVDNSTLYEKEDNYQFLTNLLTASNKNIYFNEYIHGYMQKYEPWDYYKDTLLNPISKQIGFILLILAWSVSRRFGKIRPIDTSDRKTNIEYIDAIAGFYKRAGLTGGALPPIYNQFRLSLCKGLRADPKITDENLYNLITHRFSKEEAENLINLMTKAQQAIKTNDISKQDMLDLVIKLNSYRLKGIKYDKRS